MNGKFEIPILQAAGVRNLEEAQILAECGFHYIGFPLRLAFHPTDTTESSAKEIIAQLPQSTEPVLITYETDIKELLGLIRYLDVNIVQIHSEIELNSLKLLKSSLSDIRIIKSLIVKNDNYEDLRKQIDEQSPYIDAFITDTYDFLTGACGATGKTHNWEISRKLAEFSERPLILAGGLNPENVAAGIKEVKPAGVDVHTGIEDAFGKKIPELCAKFIESAKKSFGELI